MTVILKDIPGVSVREMIDALQDIRPGQPITTGHGGFVVDEETAMEFLRAYLIAMGRLAVPVVEPPAPPAPPAPRRPAKRGTKS